MCLLSTIFGISSGRCFKFTTETGESLWIPRFLNFIVIRSANQEFFGVRKTIVSRESSLKGLSPSTLNWFWIYSIYFFFTSVWIKHFSSISFTKSKTVWRTFETKLPVAVETSNKTYGSFVGTSKTRAKKSFLEISKST